MTNVFALGKKEQAVEQMFYSQKGANALIAWIFVENHATYNL